MIRQLIACFTVGAVFAVFQVPGCSWGYPVWPKNKKSDTPLFQFVVNEKFGAGYINRQGQVVIQPQYLNFPTGEGDFFEGLAHVISKGHVSSLIDANGREVSGWDYRPSGNFSEGLATRWFADKKVYGYVDHTGRLAIPATLESATDFSEGRAVVKVSGRFGYIDHSGKLIIPARFARAEDFIDGHALVIEDGPCRYIGYGPCDGFNPEVLPALLPVIPRAPGASLKRCHYSMIDVTGRVVFGGYTDAKHASEGLVPVGDGKSWGYVDYSGRPRIPMKFDNAEPFSEGLAQVRKGDKLGFIDKSGAMVITPQFDSAEDFSEGIAVVTVAHKSWFIDPKGKRMIPGVFDAASSFVMDLAHVRVGTDYYSSKWSYIEKSGKAIFTYSDQSNRGHTP